ncbi:MAG: GMP synthase [bacterium]|nr:GMP synthase [Acidimicrobiia bacterium]MCY4650717.1 GMP synthase [bacterium]
MRIGLLVCDHVLPRLLPIAGSQEDRFTAFFSERPEIELLAYDLLKGEYPDNPSDCDGWISTGSKHAVSDGEPWVAWLAGFVRRLHEERAPHVGVCFGAQMIAHALGGEVTLQAAGWGLGVTETDVRADAAWMVPRRDTFQVVVSYQDQITKLPPGSRLLASTDHCPVSMFAIGDHVLGIGGHPEMPIPYIRGLIELKRGISIPPDVADTALDSLETTPEAPLLRNWIIEFLSRAING